jgi:hypothetical protein
MKKYLLTIFGDFKDKNLCNEIALSLSAIVDSPQLKFNHISGCLLFHFESEVTMEEIQDFCYGILYGITSSFILTEFTDKVSVCMPKDIKEHLLNLNDDSTYTDGMSFDMNKIKLNENFVGSEEENEEFVALLLDEVKKVLKAPTLDQILEKITSEGFQSLSPFEKDLLEKYSK